MTDIITTQPAQPIAPHANLRLHPADVLMNLIVTLLAPMFIAVCGGDIEYARMAATETVNGYRSRDHGDLIAIAQIIAYGLAALGSLSLSMADDLTIAMTLRLRGNANALNRSAEQNRRAIRENHRADVAPDHSQASIPAKAPIQAPSALETTPDPEQEKFEAEVLARAADTRKLVAYAQSRTQNLKPPAEPAQTATSTTAPATTATPTLTSTNPTAQEIQAMWAAAMADVADEFTAELPNLPPAERAMAANRVAALSHCANELILSPPPIRPKPGDLEALTPRNPT